MVNRIGYVYNNTLKGYIMHIPDDLGGKELHKMLYDLKFNILAGKKIFLIGEVAVIKNHCKFYKRLGNKVIYEGILHRRR